MVLFPVVFQGPVQIEETKYDSYKAVYRLGSLLNNMSNVISLTELAVKFLVGYSLEVSKHNPILFEDYLLIEAIDGVLNSGDERTVIQLWKALR